MWNKRNPRWLLVGAVVLFGVVQVIPVERTNPPEDPALTVEANTTMPDEVHGIITRACQDCHSFRTKWPWYGYVAPVSWFLADDIRRARDKVNLSEWGLKEPRAADHALDEMCEEVEKDGMPLQSYRWMHSEAKLSEEDKYALCDWAGAERGRIRAAADLAGEDRDESSDKTDDGKESEERSGENDDGHDHTH